MEKEGVLEVPVQPMSAPKVRSLQIFSKVRMSGNAVSSARVFSLIGSTREVQSALKLVGKLFQKLVSGLVLYDFKTGRLYLGLNVFKGGSSGIGSDDT